MLGREARKGLPLRLGILQVLRGVVGVSEREVQAWQRLAADLGFHALTLHFTATDVEACHPRTRVRRVHLGAIALADVEEREAGVEPAIQ